MSPIKYECINDFAGSSLYIVPNEDPKAIRSLVRGLNLDRAAAICSGGEIGLFCVLPTVKEELVLVDHCKASLAVAMAKYLFLHQMGMDTLKFFAERDGVLEQAEKQKKLLPKKVAKDLVSFADYNLTSIITFWNRIPETDMKKACKKLGLVNFVNGDLTDLIDKGPFDFLYVSNAFGHASRFGTPTTENITKIVKPGGYILSADSYQQVARAPWTIVKEAKGTSSYWYRLYKTPK